MHITVSICTWNRCQLLRQTLEQMTRLRKPESITWELLVVNNNSTDATDDVISSFRDRLPIRGLFAPQSGKSNALNLAVRESSGEYPIWTDDDVLVDEEWLSSYCRAFKPPRLRRHLHVLRQYRDLASRVHAVIPSRAHQ